MFFSEAVADYLTHIKHEKGLSPLTCQQYAFWLRHYTEWGKENGYPSPKVEEVLTLPVLRRYLYAKSKEQLRPRTLRSAFHPLRGLSAFLVTNGLLDEDNVKSITLPKLDAATRLTVTNGQVVSLFDACERQPTLRQITLYRAILAVLCYGGLRREELCDLRVSDVNPDDGGILVRSGKGSKSRQIYVCQEARDALREWLAIRERDCRLDYLFMFDRGRRVHHVTIANVIEGLKAVAGLRGNPAIKPHSLRHWCATNLLRNGANLRDVQAFLGHADLKTTAMYLHTDEQQLRNIAELTAIKKPSLPAPQSKEENSPRRRSIRRAL